MGELLSRVLDAHRGLDNWKRVTKLTARLSLGGPFWAMRGWPDVYANPTVVVDTHREHITFMSFTASDRMSIFDVDPERIRITTLDGRHVDDRTHPQGSFPAFSNDAKGDAIQRLAVTFPPSIANHNTDQVFYYDDKFMQRHMDYSPDVSGNLRIAHYTHDPKTFDGFVSPTRRLVHLRDENGIANQKFAAITVDVSSIEVVRGEVHRGG